MARKFIRHPSDIPIEVTQADQADAAVPALDNISYGGLAFVSGEHHRVGSVLRVRIPLARQPFETTARVVWSREENGRFVTGVEFLDKDDVFRMRMVEQVCHIEHYRAQVRAGEGRELTSQQAALEWIEHCADEFPNPDDESSGHES